MNSENRRHDIDWLRVIAIGLLLIYHVTNIFQPWGIFFHFIQSKEPIEALWTPMALINIWRIPLLFFVSGMGVFFAIGKRNWKQLIMERSKRILLPLIFGSIFIVPIHNAIFQIFYEHEFNYSPGVGHLWFLANIFVYVLLLSPVFFLLNRNNDSWFFRYSRRLIIYPFWVYLFIIPFVIEAVLINPEYFSVYLFSSHGFWIGLLAFFSGFYFVALGENFWKAIANIKYISLTIAFVLYIIRWQIFELKAPNYLTSIESLNWIFALLGFAFTYLNHPSGILSYLSKAAYPVYILHMAFQYLAAYLILPLNLDVVFKFILIVLFTFIGSLGFYDIVIKRIKFVSPFFGLKN